jgi:hypothetical protein
MFHVSCLNLVDQALPCVHVFISDKRVNQPFDAHHDLLPTIVTSPAANAVVRHLCPGHDTPSTDDVVRVASEQGLAVGRPGERDALRLPALLADGRELGLELVDLGLLLEVENDDAAGGGSAQPVAVGGEDEGVDLVVGVEGVEVLGLVKVPKHGGTILAAGGAERTIGGDGDGVDVAGVADVVGLELAGAEFPNLFTHR